MQKVDCIVVGAGPAGSACALTLARGGVKTVLVERGTRPGEKNVMGGVLFADVLARLITEFYQEAPLERCVTENEFFFLGPQSCVNLKFRFYELFEKRLAFTVFRRKFDDWFARKAEEAGAQLLPGVLVTDLLREDGRVVGIRAGEDELIADVVVGTDGINSVVAEKSGLRDRIAPSRCLQGVREVRDLPAEVIEDRFQLNKGEGLIKDGWGYPMEEVGGAYLLYTYNDCLSLAVFGQVEALARSGQNLNDIMETFKRHPHIYALIEGSELREYEAHMISHGGHVPLKRVYGDGVLLAGEAGGFMKWDFVGAQPAMLTGMKAAEAVIQAKKKGDYTRKTLRRYIELLGETKALQDIRTSRNLHRFLALRGHERMGAYNRAVNEIIEGGLLDEFDSFKRETYPALSRLYFGIIQDWIPRILRWPLKV
ncbi:MAG: FAD-dependent oxidoreductase, partial [Deltaproteobacteria bacterium]